LLGLVKPDPLIYKAVTDKFNVAPEEIFYTDDRPDLVGAAGKLGINSFVFKDLNKLKIDLDSLGISKV